MMMIVSKNETSDRLEQVKLIYFDRSIFFSDVSKSSCTNSIPSFISHLLESTFRLSHESQLDW